MVPSMYFVFIFALLVTFVATENPLLLVILIDGLRHDFISPNNTPNVWFLADNGVHIVNGVKPQVATSTSPNIHSIVTGLYEESHGIIDNSFYDPVFKENYYDSYQCIGENCANKLSKWYTGEPIWQTNMKIPGRCSATYFWGAGNAEINGVKPKHKYKFWTRYNPDYNSWEAEIDELLDWFTNDTNPINLALYYKDYPDAYEHGMNIFSPKVKDIIYQVDKLIGYLIMKCKQLEIFEKLNIIITSDHGFINTKPNLVQGTLWDYIRSDLVIQSSTSFFPADGKESTAEEIYKNLSKAVSDGLKIKVWRKNEFPDKYHWKNNRRVGPVIYFKEMGYEVGHTSGGYGDHLGYLNDDEEMRVVFVAFGPVFKKKYKLTRCDIENVDIYPLMCRILRIIPEPNNGSLDKIIDVLKEEYSVKEEKEFSPTSAEMTTSPTYMIKMNKFTAVNKIKNSIISMKGTKNSNIFVPSMKLAIFKSKSKKSAPFWNKESVAPTESTTDSSFGKNFISNNVVITSFLVVFIGFILILSVISCCCRDRWWNSLFATFILWRRKKWSSYFSGYSYRRIEEANQELDDDEEI